MYVRATEAFADLINAILDDDASHPFVRATRNYPNKTVGLNTFTVSDASKEVIRGVYESGVVESGINNTAVTLPFIPDKRDDYYIFDVYSILDNENPRSLLNLNFFYNPTVSNAAKMCEIKKFIEADKIVVTNRGIFVDDLVADMLRRIRFVTRVHGRRVSTQHIVLFERVPVVDILFNSPADLADMLKIYNVEVYNGLCEGVADPDEEYEGDEAEYGDIDDESRLPTHIGSTRVFSNRRPWRR